MSVRPIDADALQFKPCIISDDVGFSIGCTAIRKSEIDAAPTLDYAPVRHGEWIEQDTFCGDVYYTCSACYEDWICMDGSPVENNMHFCPCCGAKMDGGDVLNG